MQAPLSSTASGKTFRTGPLTALIPAPGHGHADSERSSDGRSPGGWVGEQFATTVGTNRKSSLNSVAEGVGLAHDAGNLLGALGLYCELLALPGVLRTEHRHYAEELQQLSGRSRELIDRLLNPATTERRQTRSSSLHEAELVVVPDVIEDCRGLLTAIARRAVVVAYEAGAALPVAVPRESLERILMNLTKNAAEAAQGTEDREGAPAITLRVTCRRKGVEQTQVVLTVEDKGCGMSTAAVKVLLGESRTNAAGTSERRGIGFQVVRELVGASGGQLRLTSQSGCGTTVAIAWDVVSDRGTESTRIAKAMRSSSSQMDSGGTFPNVLEERRRLMAMARNGRTGRLSC
jgi:signal transduction histidine kinase